MLLSTANLSASIIHKEMTLEIMNKQESCMCVCR